MVAPESEVAERGGAAETTEAAARIQALVATHYDFVWRTLRCLGLQGADAEDCAQQVMCIAARRVADIEAGAERAFLFSTTRRVAGTWRRLARRHPEEPDDRLDALAAQAPSADELLDERRARALLDTVIAAMPVEQRIVFVLFEIEELTTPAIATMIGVPVGTIASRLRKARETFHGIVARIRARNSVAAIPKQQPKGEVRP